MANRVDNVFSVQRIRQSWLPQQTEVETASRPPQEDAGGPDAAIQSQFTQLCGLVRQRFTGDRLAVMNQLLADLDDLLRRRRDAGADRPEAAQDPAEIDAAVGALLNQMEDLAEAFMLSK